MTYATPAQLLERIGARELSQIATPDDYAVVSPDLMRATIDAADRSAWTAEETTAADIALVRIVAALESAEAEIDTYLRGRYALPLAVVPRVLTDAAQDIARYNLYEDAVPEAVTTRYDNAVGRLRGIGAGTLSLEGIAPESPTGATAQGFTAGDEPFSRTNRH